MKALSLTAALFAAALSLGTISTAQAASQDILVESYSGGGLMPGFAKLDIYTNGRVVSVISQGFDAKVTTTTELATLSPAALKNLEAKVAALAPANLVDQSAGEPECMDGGSTALSVYGAQGAIKIYKNSGCHEFLREDGAGSEIKSLVDGFASLLY